MGFDELAAEADQVIQLSKDQTGEVEYPVKWVWSWCMMTSLLDIRVSKFSSVQSLLMHFSRNYGEDTTVIYYIGLQGDYKEVLI